MRKSMILLVATVVLAGCSSDELVNSPKTRTDGEAPIAFSVEKKNITRATNLEDLGHYNFGVWAYKTGSSGSKNVMNNYLVGYSDGTAKGYEKSGASTWKNNAGSETDHTSPWFYENLGTSEYSYNGTAGFYKDSQADYMSANQNQYLRYWDLAYTYTEFYAYAPYRKSGVTFVEHDRLIKVANSAQVAGYDDASLQEFIYAGAESTNAELKDVKLNFKHLGAQVNLRFYENVRGYKVEIINVTPTENGIQATPAKVTGSGTSKTYTKTDYYTDCGATIDFATDINHPTATVNFTGATQTDDNLVFAIPGAGNGVASYTAPITGVEYSVIPEDIENPSTQTYAVSPTVYYPVAQPQDSETGFTFHVSYKLIAQDNGEEITVNDARVYVPAKDGANYIAAWQPNTRYTYTFKITENSTGTTDPQSTDIDVDDPTVPANPTVYPIVFDGATVVEYDLNENEY